ncbi:MAG: protein kinase [Verrucomicrobia bacterium]|nr:protein kinase [Verrucomicrobiota bacterium]
MELGSYKILQSLGKGGMGEVFLAEDKICQRKVALKKIREDMVKFPTIRRRFLREARIASQLNHPAIIPIFSIHEESDHIYYTMPYVEGKTLKQLIREGKEIPALMRIFLSVCQAIAYTHSKGILHRDVKPENIIVGKFGEVQILDWGLAEFMSEPEEELEDVSGPPDLTRPGKVVGTLAYLAPERAKNEPATVQTDLYSLGVILYQLLTLKLPFHRVDLPTFQKLMAYEELPNPMEEAPYRDIPHPLTAIMKKCLDPDKDRRYSTATDMITDLETFLEGRPEWMLSAELLIDRREDWEFQENVLLARHIAITRATEVMEWVSLMVSKGSFAGNMRLEAEIKISNGGAGMGFLLSVPESSERKELMDGYCVWIGSESNPGCKIFCSNIEVMRAAGAFLKVEHPHRIRIEKTDNHLRFYLDGKLCCQYLSHTPLAGTHVGLLHRDADFELSAIKIYLGSQNVQVSCLAVPDAFLAHREYDLALLEYRRIATSFPGRSEEREALFRAGVTLLEQAKTQKQLKAKDRCYSLALEEFSKLRTTAGAPLEYLGKSLAYQAMGDIEEEIKCLELAIRKYVQHPLRPRLVDHIVFRLHESATHDRRSAYHFALLALRQIPEVFENPDNKNLIESLQHNWEKPSFLESDDVEIALAYHLAKPLSLLEILETGGKIEDALFALLELEQQSLVKQNPRLSEVPEIATLIQEKTANSPRARSYLFFEHFDEGNIEAALAAGGADPLLQLYALLYLRRLEEAGPLLEIYPIEEKMSEDSPLFPLYGCYLWATEGEEIGRAHMNGILEMIYPRTTALLAYYLTGKIDLKSGWITQAFFWEKIVLLRQLVLFYKCLGQEEQAEHFIALLSKEKRKLQRR